MRDLTFYLRGDQTDIMEYLIIESFSRRCFYSPGQHALVLALVTRWRSRCRAIFHYARQSNGPQGDPIRQLELSLSKSTNSIDSRKERRPLCLNQRLRQAQMALDERLKLKTPVRP